MIQNHAHKVVEQIHPDFFKYGYPLEIFCIKQIVESLTCVICLGVYRDPVTSITCGHTFCKNCFIDLKSKKSSSPPCPDCRKTISSTVETFAIKSSIQSQEVKCPLKVLKQLPCDWTGKLDQMEAHLEYTCKEIPRIKLKGYPPEIFVNLSQKDALMCNLCKGIFREPVVTECGHIFCKTCMVEHEESSSANKEAGKKLCPTCFKEYLKYFPVFQMKKMITNEQAVCVGEINGVQSTWKGIVEYWDIHRQKCKGTFKEGKERQGPVSLMEIGVRNNDGGLIVQVNQGQAQSQGQNGQQPQPQPQNNQGRPPSRHRILDSCEGCCSAIEKALKVILMALLKLVLAVFIFFLYMAAFGYVLPVRDPAIVMAFILIAYSASSGWILFFGMVTPFTLILFIDVYRNIGNGFFDNRRRITYRAMDLLSMKYACYLSTIGSDATFRDATQQEKERMTNVWHHLYWWLMKSGIYIMTLIWTAVVDESSTVREYDNLILACRIVVGVNLGMDVVDYFLTFRRIRKLHKQYNI